MPYLYTLHSLFDLRYI